MRKILFVVPALALVMAVGCSKSGSSSSETTTVSLPKLSLKADAPSGSSVSDAIMGDGLMIQGPGVLVTIEMASDRRPKTVKDDQQEFSMYSPTNIKTENLTDGWVNLFQNKGGMGTNYFVHARREIAGKDYWCDTTCTDPEQQQNALKVCKSLKKG